ncbi:hypothetical protein WICMUC_003087 [Wickerhamomyces mucosus]|uniref:NADH dehydrogenase [ubiquinone] 1 alpha subcomplex subunit 5 n=1 Tax=Wickerhamomyces mucosus TaxID=1378264 RepID=A0A9P8TD26_9ASCO|nr:hypothetical protein WICMUC_003087 [Wickerhamomyces mucosus]
MKYSRILRTTQILVRSATGNPTGITGIQQHPNPRPALIELYRSTIKLLNTFPDQSVYKKSTLEFTTKRLQVVENVENISEIEEEIGGGLVEELLIQASDEYKLAENLFKLEPWSELEDKPLEDQWVYFGKKI